MSRRLARAHGTSLLRASLLFAAIGCGDPDGPASREPAALALASNQVAIGVGDTIRLVALVTDRGAGVLADEPVQWRSLDMTKASVAATGLVLALDTGTARVVATAREFADTATVRISRRVASLTLLAPDSLLVGPGILVPVVARDAKGEVIPDAPIVWESGDSLVSIGPSGGVTGRFEGQATIRVMSGTARAEATIRTRYRRIQYGFVPTTIARGDQVTCLLAADGQVHCSGSGPALGRVEVVSPAPLGPVASDERFVALSGSNNSMCAITAASRLFCWGNRNGTDAEQSSPAPVIDSVPVRAISLGTEGVNCLLGTDGIARCWGRNDAYQAGFEPLGDPLTPQPVATAERFSALAVGFHDACGIAMDGVPVCWGELPDRYDPTHYTGRLRFMRFTGAPPLVSIAINGYANACGLTATGETWCWGTRDVGAGTPTTTPYAPTRVSGIPAMRMLVGNFGGICGIGIEGEVFCWGDQTLNQTPRRWRAPYRFRTVAMARLNLLPCGVTTEDEVIC